jgi:ubiquitin carboxyl-terminal hydrolase L5
MSLCKSPLRSIQENLAQSMHSISAVEKALSALVPDWKLFMDADESISVTDLNESLGLPQDLINNATPSVSAIRRLEEVANDPGMLMSYRKTLMGEQSKLRAAYLQEVAEISQEDEQAERRKHDYTPTVYNSIKSLAEAGVLKDIVMDTRGN